MVKTKNAFSIVAMVLAVIGAALLICIPIFDFLASKISSGSVILGDAFSGHMSALFTGDDARIKKLIDFNAIFSSFSMDSIKTNIPQAIVVGCGGIAAILFIILLVVVIAKKRVKDLGFAIPTFILTAVAIATLAVMMTEPHIFNVDEKYVSYEEIIYFMYGVIAVAGLAVIFGIVYMILNIITAAKKSAEKVEEKMKDTKEAVVEETTKTTVEETIVPVAADKATERVAKEPADVANTKVVRRILVHKTGKVVRVLNEHYYDVTTNIYVEPGFVDPSMPTETEAEHYEKIIKASATKPTPVVAPAPKKAEPAPAPAPAPVVEEVAKVKVERIPFAVRMKKADKTVKLAYNEIKSELLSYGFKSRISFSGDTFRLHTKTYAKIVSAGKSLKMYFALKPKDYKDSTIPVGDASDKSKHVDTPLVFKVKSDLSVRRAKTLIADVAKVDNIPQGEVVKHDHAKEVK